MLAELRIMVRKTDIQSLPNTHVKFPHAQDAGGAAIILSNGLRFASLTADRDHHAATTDLGDLRVAFLRSGHLGSRLRRESIDVGFRELGLCVRRETQAQ